MRTQVRPFGEPPTLREFVYLDEVSLRSLLSSQTGEMTDEVSDEVARSREMEVGAGINASVLAVGGAEVSSRFQTSNSSTLQTSRKATVQSWFREFHRIPNIRLIGLPKAIPDFSVDTETELARGAHEVAAIRAADLARGSLVEFRVKLTADPVFHMSTMVAEFVGMAADFPEKLAPDAAKALQDVAPINKLLDKLLAGLIPIRAEALDYVVATLKGEEHLVHKAVATRMALQSCPLVIVGVTEHLAYWKDIRRVLFSGAEFSIMCRVARSALQSTWTPVKLADLFRKAVPDLVEQIDTASRFSLMPGGASRPPKTDALQQSLIEALSAYARALLAETHDAPTQEQENVIATEIDRLASRGSTAIGQREAFSAIKALVGGWATAEVGPAKDLEFREAARLASSLPYFPDDRSETTPLVLGPAPSTSDRLLDVEVVAIYW